MYNKKVMEKKVEQGFLYDFYGPLLTEHQQKIYEMSVFDDLSLSEIAEQEGISRQGVSDLLHRCDKALAGYEEKLKLMERFLRNRERLEKLRGDVVDEKDKELLDAVLEEL